MQSETIRQSQDDSSLNGGRGAKSKYILTATALFAVIAGLYVLSRYNYPLFHSFADMVTILISVAVFLVVWNGRRLLDNQYYLYVGIALLFFAFLDFMHLLGNKGMGVFPQYGNLGPTFYIASRYVLSISLVIAPLFIARKINTTLILALYSAVTTLLLLSIFYWKIFPVTFIDGVGLTPFKVISDYVICLILLGAIGLLIRNRRAFDAKVLKIIIAALILAIATGLAFTLYTDPFGIANAVGHYLQIGSFFLIYVGFVETTLTRPQNIIFRNLKQSKEEVLRLNSELGKANLNLNRDVAERKKAEENLRVHSVELEAANKELESFSYSVSHDLRAPLRTLDGFSEIVLLDYGDKLDETGKDYLNRIRRASQNMSRLTDDILKLSRVSRADMRPERVDLSEMASSIMSELRSSQPGRQAEVMVAPDLIVSGDRPLLQILMRNLLENAWKYTSHCPSTRIEIGATDQKGARVWFIKDNGIGFDMQYAGKLFEPFQRLQTNRDYPGSGIGLATAQRVVRKHDGRIWAESQPGEGATFYFTLG